MGTANRPAKTLPGPWDAFANVDVFVDEVLAELAAMAKAGARPVQSGPKPSLGRRSIAQGRHGALVHLAGPRQGDLNPARLCDGRLATDGIRAADCQHPVQHRHTDGSLALLGSKAAGA
jgi:hypothetical protein